MVDTAQPNDALALAISSLAAAVANINSAPQSIPIHDLFASGNALNLGTRSGMEAYEKMVEPLSQVWDGTPASFPTFIMNLRLRASKSKWNATGPSGIMDVDGNNILTSYHSIVDAQVESARSARVNPRAIQNSKALYHCLESSISGPVKTTIFTQAENIPKHEDGIALFKLITRYTAVSSVQLSNLSLQQILEFDPARLDFDIPNINTSLVSLFVLATTQNRKLDQSERIQHTLNAYSKILQPEPWAQWTRNRIDDFESDAINDCQALMNSAVLKSNKIIANKGKFDGSTSTVQEDIIAMFSKQSRPKVVKRKMDDEDDERRLKPKLESRSEYKRCPFIKHTHEMKNGTKTNYKLGDKKDFTGKTFYFCDCPNHKNNAHWHPHPHNECRTRQRWLKKTSNKSVEANLVEREDTIDTDEPEVADPIQSDNQGIQALLASALNMVQDDHVVRDAICDALNSLS